MITHKSFGKTFIVSGSLIATLILTFLVIRYPGLATLLIGAVLLTIATWRVPEAVLAASLVLTLTGGSFGQSVIYGNLAIAFAGMLSLFFLLGNSRPDILKPLTLPFVLISVMALRYAIEGDFNSVTTALLPGASLFLVALCISRKRDITRALVVSGIIYILATVLLGEYNEVGTRYMGVAGNPNRMSFALLVYIPFFLFLFHKSRRILVKLLCAASIALSLTLLIMSQSSQAIVGLIVIGLGLLWVRIARRSIITKYSIGIVALSLSLLFYFQLWPEIQVDEDLATFSGRTPLYEVAWAEFLREPLYGTGDTHVSDGMIVDRSAHSSILGFLAYGGVIAGIPWLLILLKILIGGVERLRKSNVLGLVPLLLILIQFVHAVEYMILTWTVIALFSYSVNHSDNTLYDKEDPSVLQRGKIREGKLK